MARTGARGLALAVIDDGRVALVRTWGRRNAAGAPLAARHDHVRRLADQGGVRLHRDAAGRGGADRSRPLDRRAICPRPLPEYDREEEITRRGTSRRRRALAAADPAHPADAISSGFGQFRTSSSRTSGSASISIRARATLIRAKGMILLQFVLERGLGLDVGAEMQRRVFDRFGMRNTSMIWRPDFAAQPRRRLARRRQRSSRTTSAARSARGGIDGHHASPISPASPPASCAARGCSAASRAEMLEQPAADPLRPASFRPLQPEPAGQRWPGLGAGLASSPSTGRRAAASSRAGTTTRTANIWVCLERRQALRRPARQRRPRRSDVPRSSSS